MLLFVFPLVFVRGFVYSLRGLVYEGGVVSFERSCGAVARTLQVVADAFPAGHFVCVSGLFLRNLLETIRGRGARLVATGARRRVSQPSVFLRHLGGVRRMAVPFLVPRVVVRVFRVVGVAVAGSGLLSYDGRHLHPFVRRVAVSGPYGFISMDLFFGFLFSFFRLLYRYVGYF